MSEQHMKAIKAVERRAQLSLGDAALMAQR